MKTGTRVYAHPVCLFKRRGEAAIRTLHLWQLRALPVILLAKAGLAPARLEAIIAEREAVEAMLSERAPAQRARAAADRHAAELALGTATEVSR